jgi:hypothetical protein
LQAGSLGIVAPLNDETIAQLTDRVIANTLYDDSVMSSAEVPAGSPIPGRPGEASPIRYVIYVVKENRTFDQVLGDFPGAEGDPALVVFGEDTAPNHRKLAREFTLLDNFYTAGDVSADGQNWSFAALANDFIEKLWPSYYGRRRGVYDFEGGEPAAVPPAGYLWTNARAAAPGVAWSARCTWQGVTRPNRSTGGGPGCSRLAPWPAPRWPVCSTGSTAWSMTVVRRARAASQPSTL